MNDFHQSLRSRAGCRIAILLAALLLCVHAPARAQQKQVPVQGTLTGTVSGDDGILLPGVQVRNATTGEATVTDRNAAYKIGVSGPKDILTFTYLGYDQVDRVAGTAVKMDIVMKSATKALDEVVVIGYGEIKKRDITGAISSMSKADIDNRLPTNVYEALQGGATGVQVVTGSGQPGESASVVIRGMSTMNDDGIGPLWVVDGVPTSNVDDLNPYDIESMEILKDATSAAIYGSRSANGVIIVTTKKGSEKRPVLEVRYLYSISEMTHKLPQMNTSQYRRMQKGLAEYAAGEGNGLVASAVQKVLGSQMADSLNYLLSADNDYQDLAFRTAHKNQLDVSFGGGSQKLKYMLVGGLLDEQGVINNTSFKRFSARVNADYIANKHLTLSTRFNASYARKDGIDEAGFLNSLLMRKPNLSLYYPDETLIGTLWGINPVAANLQTNFTDIYRGTFFQLLEYKFIEGLKFTTNFNANYSQHRYNFMKPTLLSDSYLNNYGNHNSTLNYDWMNENYLNYTKSFCGEKHNLSAMLGFSMQGWKTEYDYYSGKNSATDALYTMNAFAANFDLTKTGTTETAHNMMSFFGRVTYNYKSKYLFAANLRADGSSRFAKDKKFGYFPSASAAWRFTDEKFMEGTRKWFNDGKIRVSYGITGNESIGDYESVLTYSIGSTYDGVSGVTPSRISVDDLGWEQTAQTNVGLDLALLKNRLRITFDLYNKETTNLLANYEIPKEWGFNVARKNIGSIQNRGLEVSVSADVIKKKDISLNLSGNLSINRNKVLSLAQGNSYIYDNRWWISEGRPLGDFYGYTYLGVFQYDQSNAFTADWAQLTPVFQRDAAGNMIQGANGKYVLDHYTLGNEVYTGTVKQKTLPDGTPFRGGDINWQESPDATDGVISDKDRTVLGNAQPDFTGGISLNFTYRSWSLYASAYYSIGGKIYNQARYNRDQASMAAFSTVPSVDWLDNFWVRQGDDVQYPRPFTDSFQNGREINSIYIEDASYVKIRNIRLSYRFPAKWANKIRVRGMSAYVFANNPFTWTTYSGYDPEFSSFSALALGMDTNRFPRKREFGLGVNLNF